MPAADDAPTRFLNFGSSGEAASQSPRRRRRTRIGRSGPCGEPSCARDQGLGVENLLTSAAIRVLKSEASKIRTLRPTPDSPATSRFQNSSRVFSQGRDGPECPSRPHSYVCPKPIEVDGGPRTSPLPAPRPGSTLALARPRGTQSPPAPAGRTRKGPEALCARAGPFAYYLPGYVPVSTSNCGRDPRRAAGSTETARFQL